MKVEELGNYLTLAEVSRETGLSKDCLAQRIGRGQLASILVVGRRMVHRNTVAQMKKHPVKLGRPRK